MYKLIVYYGYDPTDPKPEKFECDEAVWFPHEGNGTLHLNRNDGTGIIVEQDLTMETKLWFKTIPNQ